MNVNEIIKEMNKSVDSNAYYEEAVYGIRDTFKDIEIKEVSEEIVEQRRWETDTEYIFEITNNKDTVYIGIIDTTGNTESQENQGITDIYEVIPKKITTTIYERVKEED